MKTKEAIFREWRISNKLTRKQSTKLMNVSASCLESWEQGRRRMTGSAQRLFEIYRNFPFVFLTFLDEGKSGGCPEDRG